MATLSGTTTRTVKVPARARFERFFFMYMRMSGVALLILAVGHMLIQHVLNSSSSLTIQFVADQWNSWGWKLFDILLLAFALVHGFNGLRNVLEDYIHNESVTKALNWFLLFFGIATVLWCAYAIASFEAVAVFSAQ
jgi:succinate dehydrogenase / fumarate reductase membrane anchor subunit